MDSRNPSLILQDSPAPCLTTSQGTQDATLTSQDTPANYTVFTPAEPSPAPWDSNGVVRRAQEWGGDTPTGAANVEGVHVTPPTSLTGSSKSRVSLVSMCRICHEGKVRLGWVELDWIG
ncbi:hypothetical protein E2C01_025177 [Portunus trituberculatus]|uniref:Uncharacterized protein n=1 Tax=Portunus trituberculatus TaxID=210409 RepID=A0A5B7EEI6_PORTR|nr:hypothetical protein [Portunus trituberculatus]